MISKKNKKLTTFKGQERFVLVLWGGGTRGFYTLWVLKALEEAGYREKIDAVYGVSVWAIIGAYWTAGYSAQEIFDNFKHLEVSPTKWIALFSKQHLLKTDYLEKKFRDELPATFEELELPLYITATDLRTAKMIIFNKEELVTPVLASMAIPWIFPIVEYQKYLLVDGWVIDNFPTTTAKRNYPNHKIIGIALNMFKKNKRVKGMIDTLTTAFEIMLRKDQVKRTEDIDISFYEAIDCKVLDIHTKKREKAFQQGYESWKKTFALFSEK